MVALVGLTGAGKTTLVSLIPRFYDPTAGRVLGRRRDVRAVPRRDRCASRSPSCCRIRCSFRARLPTTSATAASRRRREEIEEAARAAHAHEFISRLPKGYDTEIAEAGGGLSGGERQRLSVARAILKNAPILILDEPTSSLDAISEEIVFSALRRLRAGRTTIVIAHRLSTVRDADRILVLDGGRIAAQGRHEELLKTSQLYRRMCARLSVGKSLDEPETRRRIDPGGAERSHALPLDEDSVRGHHRPLPVRRRDLVLADVSARPARARARSVLHRGHGRVRLRSGPKHPRRPIPRYGTTYIHAALEPFGLGDAGRS